MRQSETVLLPKELRMNSEYGRTAANAKPNEARIAIVGFQTEQITMHNASQPNESMASSALKLPHC